MRRSSIQPTTSSPATTGYNATTNVATVNLTRNTGYLLPRTASSNFWGMRDMQLGIKFLF